MQPCTHAHTLETTPHCCWPAAAVWQRARRASGAPGSRWARRASVTARAQVAVPHLNTTPKQPVCYKTNTPICTHVRTHVRMHVRACARARAHANRRHDWTHACSRVGREWGEGMAFRTHPCWWSLWFTLVGGNGPATLRADTPVDTAEGMCKTTGRTRLWPETGRHIGGQCVPPPKVWNRNDRPFNLKAGRLVDGLVPPCLLRVQ